MKVAVLDDGIYPGVLKVPKVVSRVSMVPENERKNSPISHGTICAAILKNFHPRLEVFDVTIISNKGTSSVYNLISGLSWCLQKDIQIIHLSLGTTVFQDFKLLQPILEKLLSCGKIIIAAFSNRNVMSYPAAFPGIFGVRRGNTNIMRDQMALCENHWLNGTNAWIATCLAKIPCIPGGCISIVPCNSYAAVTVTAQIIQLLKQNPTWGCTEIQMKLETIFGRIQNRPDDFNTFSWVKDTEDSCIYVQILEQDFWYAYEASAYLKKEGFPVEILGGKEGIPISMYFSSPAISLRKLKGIGKIYNTSVLFIIYNTELKFADAFSNEQRTLIISGCKFSYSTGIDLAKLIINNF